jgi:hypothetical protein
MISSRKYKVQVFSDVFSPQKKDSITMDPKFTKLLDPSGLDDFNSHIVSTIIDPVLFS